jgi:hypothetical protein
MGTQPGGSGQVPWMLTFPSRVLIASHEKAHGFARSRSAISQDGAGNPKGGDMSNLAVIGLDIAKNVFPVHGADNGPPWSDASSRCLGGAVQAGALDPGIDDPRILPRREVRLCSEATRKEVLCVPRVARRKPVLDRGAGLLGDLKLNRPAYLLLNDRSAVSNSAAGANIVDLQPHEGRSLREGSNAAVARIRCRAA